MTNVMERHCNECGAVFTPKKHNAIFCSVGCKSEFNHRRKQRGSVLYDLVMQAEYGGMSQTDLSAVLRSIEKLRAAFRNSDLYRREGRQSWQDWEQVRKKLPSNYSIRGDGR